MVEVPAGGWNRGKGWNPRGCWNHLGNRSRRAELEDELVCIRTGTMLSVPRDEQGWAGSLQFETSYNKGKTEDTRNWLLRRIPKLVSNNNTATEEYRETGRAMNWQGLAMRTVNRRYGLCGVPLLPWCLKIGYWLPTWGLLVDLLWLRSSLGVQVFHSCRVLKTEQLVGALEPRVYTGSCYMGWVFVLLLVLCCE